MGFSNFGLLSKIVEAKAADLCAIIILFFFLRFFEVFLRCFSFLDKMSEICYLVLAARHLFD